MNTAKFEAILAENRTLIMGVLNVTPDSFSDGGAFFTTDMALDRAAIMLSEGADIIDIGGQSTRPPGNTYGKGAVPVSLEEELQRVLPVIDSLVLEFPDIIISIDTTKAEVAKRALESGATIINDVSGATEEPGILAIASEKHVPVILMHGYGPQFSNRRIDEFHYQNVVKEVFDWLEKRIIIAKESGITIVLADIGFGFAKNAEDNILLLKELRQFSELHVPMVLGVSRKSTIGRMLGGVQPLERINGSIAAAAYGVMHGAKIIRTHDIKQTVDALEIIDRLME